MPSTSRNMTLPTCWWHRILASLSGVQIRNGIFRRSGCRAKQPFLPLRPCGTADTLGWRHQQFIGSPSKESHNAGPWDSTVKPKTLHQICYILWERFSMLLDFVRWNIGRWSRKKLVSRVLSLPTSHRTMWASWQSVVRWECIQAWRHEWAAWPGAQNQPLPSQLRQHHFPSAFP